MDLFGKLPQEQAMQRLIHDTNQELANLRFCVKGIAEWLAEHNRIIREKGEVTIDSKPYVHLEYMKSANEKLTKIVDEYYLRFKSDFTE